ncbi:FAD-dependent oxidoreductase [Herbaspirillum sp. RV1423]|uniref:FAD-dependent oxidoreductase n=1 Tax=Herbaspirillum sp. RV1423 TaxID=1443993 RepID=UPI0004B32BA0|nr:FAD-dependent oxidoreductase [Herbaspirillum sp. RV1423]
MTAQQSKNDETPVFNFQSGDEFISVLGIRVDLVSFRPHYEANYWGEASASLELVTIIVTHNKTLKQIAIVGGGLSGVTTAYFLARAGFEVAVLERRANVAEEATFGNSGLLAPCAVQPLVLPGIIKTAFSNLFKNDPPILVKSGFNPSRWRWVRKSRREQRDYFSLHKQRLTRLSAYGQMLALHLQEQYALEQENSQGLLHLFRQQADADRCAGIEDSLQQFELPRRNLKGLEAIQQVEPAFQSAVPIAGAMYYPQDAAGNCVLFVKQLRAIAQSIGVQFHFSQSVRSIRPEFGGRVSIDVRGVDDASGDSTLTVDGVVLAAGIQNMHLLRPLGVSLPLCPLQSYNAMAAIKNLDETPRTALFDETYKVAIARVGNRIRVSGLLGFLPRTDLPHTKAIASLLKVANDYYPNAANFNTANFWSSTFALQPNGMPLVGGTAHGNIFINTGHGVHGWSAAVGSAKLLADAMAGRETEIDSDGLLLSPSAA